MGQKVNPVGLRLGINRTWDSRWYSGKGDYGKLLHEDMQIREDLSEALKQAAVSKIVIERPHKKCRVTIYAARPGVIIGKKGADIEKLRKDLSDMAEGEVHLNIVEVRKPEVDSQLVAENIAQQLERRVAFRRAMKRSMQSAMRLGAKGVRINVSGRLGGAEIARMEWYREGRVPLHTLRADIDYGFFEARTTTGRIGVKCWINKGEVMPEGFRSDLVSADEAPAGRPGGGREGGRDRGGRGDRDRGGRGPGGGGRGPGGGGRGPGGPGGGRGPGGGGGRGPGGPGGGRGPGGGGRGPGGGGGRGPGGGGGRGPGGPGGGRGPGGGNRGPGGGGR